MYNNSITLTHSMVAHKFLLGYDSVKRQTRRSMKFRNPQAHGSTLTALECHSLKPLAFIKFNNVIDSSNLMFISVVCNNWGHVLFLIHGMNNFLKSQILETFIKSSEFHTTPLSCRKEPWKPHENIM